MLDEALESLTRAWEVEKAKWQADSRFKSYTKQKIRYADTIIGILKKSHDPKDELSRRLDDMKSDPHYSDIMKGSHFSGVMSKTEKFLTSIPDHTAADLSQASSSGVRSTVTAILEPITVPSREADDTLELFPEPRPYEFFLMADAVYDVPDRHTTAIAKLKTLDDAWEERDLFEKDRSMRALLFVNHKTHQLVIAFRGTAPEFAGTFIDTMITDFISVLGHKRGKHEVAAKEILFHPKVVNFLRAGFKLHVTGHSLGGFLSEGCVYLCQDSEFIQVIIDSLKDDSPDIPEDVLREAYTNISGVTFDSPGFDPTAAHQNLLNTISFKFLPNPIDMALPVPNPHMVYALVPELDIDIQKGPLAHLGEVHGMTAYHNCFDEATGYPKENRWKRVGAWPVLDPGAMESLVQQQSFTEVGKIYNIKGLLSLLGNGLMANIPGTEKRRAYLELREQILGTREANTSLSRRPEDLVKAYLAHQYLEISSDPAVLMHTLSASAFPQEIRHFIYRYDAFKKLIQHDSGLSEKLERFHTQYELTEAEILLLDAISVNHNNEFQSREKNIFCMKDELMALNHRFKEKHHKSLLEVLDTFLQLDLERRIRDLENASRVTEHLPTADDSVEQSQNETEERLIQEILGTVLVQLDLQNVIAEAVEGEATAEGEGRANLTATDISATSGPIDLTSQGKRGAGLTAGGLYGRGNASLRADGGSGSATMKVEDAYLDGKFSAKAHGGGSAPSIAPGGSGPNPL